jgi:hypothetical protein
VAHAGRSTRHSATWGPTAGGCGLVAIRRALRRRKLGPSEGLLNGPLTQIESTTTANPSAGGESDRCRMTQVVRNRTCPPSRTAMATGRKNSTRNVTPTHARQLPATTAVDRRAFGRHDVRLVTSSSRNRERARARKSEIRPQPFSSDARGAGPQILASALGPTLRSSLSGLISRPLARIPRTAEI